MLCAFNVAKVDPQAESVRRAVAWLKAVQNADGGWGEGAESYEPGYAGLSRGALHRLADGLGPARPDGGRPRRRSRGGAAASIYLRDTQAAHGVWDEARFTATGFPRVFYLRYHGYAKFFPLWALARFRNLKASNHRQILAGM